MEEEYVPNYSLLPNKKNLLTVEELRDQIRFKPHYAIEGIIVDCANRISKIASCSNNIRGGTGPRFENMCKEGAGEVPAARLNYKGSRRR